MNNINVVGYSAQTPQHIMLNEGAIYLNYGTASEVCLGACSGGNEFDVVVSTYDVAIGGITAKKIKGLEFITDVAVSLKVNMLEVTTANLVTAIQGSTANTLANPNYDIINLPMVMGNGNQNYLTNVALVSTIMGSALPVVVLLFNSMSTGGIKYSLGSGKDNIFPIEFDSFLDPLNPTNSLFEIHNPKLMNAGTFNTTGVPFVDSARVSIAYTDILMTAPPLAGFTVTIAGVTDIITACTRSTNQTNVLYLALTTAPTSGQAVTVTYTQPVPTASQIVSLNGVVAPSFLVTNVTNN